MEATRQTRGGDGVDSGYLENYNELLVHKMMLKDNVRTESYRTAVKHHQKFIEGKVVLDVGCGTGILSLFCAQAGAKRVYAVDASEIALQARKVVEENNFSDVITVLHARVEDVELDEEVDVIISEWMGNMLLQESMLGSVIIARDRWLKREGLILPSDAKLYMAPFTDSERYGGVTNFWRDVHGFDMSSLIPLEKSQSFGSPWIETIKVDNLLGYSHIVKDINMHSISKPELESITTTFKFNSNKNAPLHGFAFWFDVEFARTSDGTSAAIDEAPHLSTTLLLSTAPKDPPTHWKRCYSVMMIR